MARASSLVRKFSAAEAARLSLDAGGNTKSSWLFKADFGMSCWFRADRFDAQRSKDPVLPSVRSQDCGRGGHFCLVRGVFVHAQGSSVVVSFSGTVARQGQRGTTPRRWW